MNDDQTDVKEVAGEEASNADPSTGEPKATEEVKTPAGEPQGEEVEGKPEGEEAETGETPKKGATQRIRELNAKAKSAEAKANSLEAKLAELTGGVTPTVPQGAYTPQVEPGA